MSRPEPQLEVPLGERFRSEEHTSELQSPCNLVCRLLLEKKKHKLTWGLDRDVSRVSLYPRHDAAPSRGRVNVQIPEIAGSAFTGSCSFFFFFFFNDRATTEIYPLSLPAALPISTAWKRAPPTRSRTATGSKRLATILQRWSNAKRTCLRRCLQAPKCRLWPMKCPLPSLGPEYDLVARSNLFDAVASISPPRMLTWTIKAPIWRRPAIFQATDIRNISASCCFTPIGCILKIRGEDNGKILRAGQRQFRQRRPPGHRKYANPGGCRPE